MQTQFVLIILLFCFIQATGCLMQGTGNVGQSISNEVLRGPRTQTLGQRAIALTQPQPLARPKQAGKLGEGGGGGSAAQKAREALMEAALQHSQAMRKARAEGLRPGQKPPYEPLPGIEGIKGEYRPRLAPKVAKELLENNREGMSPEFRDQIISYLTEVAKRSRKKSDSVPQKK